jgi:hypothetical protein
MSSVWEPQKGRCLMTPREEAWMAHFEKDLLEGSRRGNLVDDAKAAFDAGWDAATRALLDIDDAELKALWTMTKEWKPQFGDFCGPWIKSFAWLPINTFDAGWCWFSPVWKRRVHKHQYLIGGGDFWWLYRRYTPLEAE